jgi:hypothetical protein
MEENSNISTPPLGPCGLLKGKTLPYLTLKILRGVHIPCMCCERTSEQTATFALYYISDWFRITEVEGVYCAARLSPYIRQTLFWSLKAYVI